jgi:hypothetical protein
MRDGAAGQRLDRKSGALSTLCKFNVANAVAKSYDYMHAARPEIHLEFVVGLSGLLRSRSA